MKWCIDHKYWIWIPAWQFLFMNSSLVCALVDRSANQAGCSSRLEACMPMMIDQVKNYHPRSPVSTRHLSLNCYASGSTFAESPLPWNQAPGSKVLSLNCCTIINVLNLCNSIHLFIEVYWWHHLIVDRRGSAALSEQCEQPVKDVFRSWRGGWDFSNHKKALWSQAHQVIVIVHLNVWLIVSVLLSLIRPSREDKGIHLSWPISIDSVEINPFMLMMIECIASVTSVPSSVKSGRVCEQLGNFVAIFCLSSTREVQHIPFLRVGSDLQICSDNHDH